MCVHSVLTFFFFFSSRRRHTRSLCDWSSDVCSSDLSHFFRPTSVSQAVTFLFEHDACLIVSGATDLGVQRNKGIRKITKVLSTAALPGFREIEVRGGELLVGAGAS